MTSTLRAHSHRALDALHALEARNSASKIKTLDLSLPPRPVPRRKRPFIAPQQPAPAPPAAPVADIVLDGFVLLEACRVEDPDEAEKAVLEGCGISSVISEDLSFFRKLTHLDLGDNRVQLASLAYLPALVELHLDCNGLCECSCPASGFPCLEVLNLSYNGLSTAAIAALADLPRLRQLDLSMNELTALPADMSAFTALQARLVLGAAGCRAPVSAGSEHRGTHSCMHAAALRSAPPARGASCAGARASWAGNEDLCPPTRPAETPSGVTFALWRFEPLNLRTFGACPPTARSTTHPAPAPECLAWLSFVNPRAACLTRCLPHALPASRAACCAEPQLRAQRSRL